MDKAMPVLHSGAILSPQSLTPHLLYLSTCRMFASCPMVIEIAGQTLLNFLLCALWAVPLIGWGQGFFRLCRFQVKSLPEYVAAFWAGLACVVLFGQWWHLLLPINGVSA